MARQLVEFPVNRDKSAKINRLLIMACVGLALASCDLLNRPGSKETLFEPIPVSVTDADNFRANGGIDSEGENADQTDALTEPRLFPGTNQYVKPPSDTRRAAEVGEKGEIVLNFENVPLRDVVRDILGRILDLNYLFDARVEGTVSLRTTKPISRDAVMPTLEMILRQNGAALVEQEGLYRIVPADEAVRSQVRPMLGNAVDPIRPGYGVLIVPLQYISAVQMSNILEPLVPPEGVLRVDIDRNVIILAGTSGELQSLRDTVEIFDVDWLKGMSAGLFPLVNVSAQTVAQELDVIFGDPAQGPLAGLMQLVPIERLNALLVVTQRSEYLEQAQTWIERLDQGAESGLSLFVYYVQNGKASELATILNQIFSGQEQPRAESRSIVAPGLEPTTIQTTRAGGGGPPAKAVPQIRTGATVPSMAGTSKPSSGADANGGLAFAEGADIRIIADEVNNALLILATPGNNRMVQAALRKLDIVPLQVLVDATIADVTLTDQLRYGVQHFLNSGNSQATLTTGPTQDISSTFPGFSYSFLKVKGGAILDALQGVTRVNIKSSPRLMVLDNQTARLQVGDEVPVITQQQQSTLDTANIINSIQFRQTGVILEVTPRVNAGGMVTLDIETEVSNVSQTLTTGLLTPTISQRKIKSSIAIQSGETVLLGGLIQENTTETSNGLPVLSRLPLLGGLFGQIDNQTRGTELIVLLTPHVVRNPAEARAITEEIRSRMRNFAPVTPVDKDE
ncbi:MAG: type II secretion system secretin GspD [Sphingomonadales bacterium]